VISVGYCQKHPAVSKDDAVRIAKEYIQTLNPPVDLSYTVKEPKAVFFEKEDVWIIWQTFGFYRWC